MGSSKNIFISNNTLPHVPPGYIYTVDMFKLYFDPHKTDGGMIPFCQGMKKLMYVKLLIMEYSACWTYVQLACIVENFRKPPAQQGEYREAHFDWQLLLC